MSQIGQPRVTVVVPARNAERTLGECLRALASQTLPRGEFEVTVVVDRDSRDGSAAIASAAGVRVLTSDAAGAAAARNTGIAAATTEWVAFTDADCIPSRAWLSQLLTAVHETGDPKALGAAGPTLGHQSTTAAARFVDLTGGLRADRHLAHARYPWAPTGNVMYRRAALDCVGGFDVRFRTYEGCDLHTRLVRKVGGGFGYAPGAVVLHHHRAGWRSYWRQQVGYGIGYGQFFRRYEGELSWTAGSELRAWASVVRALGRAAIPRRGDAGLLARGSAVKLLAQRIGFMRSYWNRGEARRLRKAPSVAAGASS
ncbi:MAG TPA: glycosyltransferase [Candidatus Limnocylindria bacterium]|nr:glycosyltransferase [Candidatus Limnocylindria bacterium]